METTFKWRKFSDEKPQLNSPIIYLSLGGLAGLPKQEKWYRGFGLYVDLGFGPHVYDGNEVYRVIYWAYIPEVPERPGIDA